MNKNNTIEMNAVNASMTEFSTEITGIIRSSLTPKKMREKMMAYHEKDIAQALELLSKEECLKLFKVLSVEKLAEVMEYAEDLLGMFQLLTVRQKVEVLSLMDASISADLLRQLNKEERNSLMGLMSAELRSEMNLLCSFDEDEIGSRMSTNYIEISEQSTIKEAMSELIRQAAENDNISMLYVVDEDKTFCGAIDLKDLIVARDGMELSEIVTFSYPYVYAEALIEDCIPMFIDYSEAAIPVLDEDNHLIGVVTAQDFIEVMDEEFSEDYAKLGGLSAEEDLNESILESIKKRLPWLCVLLVMGLGVSATVGLFESIVEQLPIIMCFQSLILDMAGNVGTQSLAVAIRVLMDKQVGAKQKTSLIWKELRVGFANGCILGALSLVAIGLYLMLKGYDIMFAFAVSGCLGAALLLAMVVSSLSGTVIPIAFQKMGVDPAVASGPLITTINDLVAVIAYYGLAWLILIHCLHLG